MKAIKDYSIASLHSCELWPNYYRIRYLEFLSIYRNWPTGRVGNLLEIGCGMGYCSAFLAQLADHVLATDRPEKDTKQHSIGIQRAIDYLERIGIDNVESRVADAETLPFSDGEFDLIYSMWVMQHIDDKEKAAAEMVRVLKPGGYAVHLLPSRMLLVYSFARFHVRLVGRACYHLYKKLMSIQKDRSVDKGLVERSVSKIVKESGQFSSYPLQPVFGMYGSNAEEWTASGKKQWRQLLSGNGQLKVLQQVSITLNPWYGLVDCFSPSLAVTIYGACRTLDLMLGRFRIFQWLGSNTLLIMQKPDTTR